jgi:hypothetical protein
MELVKKPAYAIVEKYEVDKQPQKSKELSSLRVAVIHTHTWRSKDESFYSWVGCIQDRFHRLALVIRPIHHKKQRRQHLPHQSNQYGDKEIP